MEIGTYLGGYTKVMQGSSMAKAGAISAGRIEHTTGTASSADSASSTTVTLSSEARQTLAAEQSTATADVGKPSTSPGLSAFDPVASERLLAANGKSTHIPESDQARTRAFRDSPEAAAIQKLMAEKSGSLRLSEADVAQMRAYDNRPLPPDIINEAKARLAAQKGLGGCRSALGMELLPLLPENRALIAEINKQDREAFAADADGIMNLTPSMHLIMAIQREGWKRPMTMADARREADITTAMWRLSPPLSDAEAEKNATIFEQRRAGQIPDVWKQRWQQENLTMPDIQLGDLGRSMWLDLAQAAGISENDFLAKARQFATSYSGNAFVQAIEQFISERNNNQTKSV